MGNTPFPLSYSRVHKEWTPETDPLDVLHPNEIRAAELYAALWLDPAIEKRKGPAMNQLPWGTAFRETFGIELDSKIKKLLHSNPAWTAYVKMLKTQTRAVVMRKMEQDALGAYEDHKWARKRAKEKDDYKEARLAADAHLDRVVGAAMRPAAVQQAVVVVIKSPNFDGNLGRLLPAVEAEIVQEDESA